MTAPRVGDLEAPPGPPTPRRRIPEPGVAAVLGVAVSLLLVWLHHPRMGLYLLGILLAGLGALRLVLPARDAGLLVVRSRAFDVVLLLLLALAVLVMAVVTRFPAPGP